MKQNVYDDPRFFAGYAELRRHERGLNTALEGPAFFSLLPPLAGLRVLDLGCGFGKWARHLRAQGAARVVGIDLSAKMLARARAETADAQICYVRCAIEDAAFFPHSFDLVTSSLALHYVSDYAAVCRKVAAWLAAGGRFVFSVEHPIYTALFSQHWCLDERGARRHWPVDEYQREGARRVNWYVEGVIKYHRTLETWLNTLIDSGFALERLREPAPSPDFLAEQPDLIDEARRPAFLLIAARLSRG